MKCRRCQHDKDDHRAVVNGADFCYVCMNSPCGQDSPKPTQIPKASKPKPNKPRGRKGAAGIKQNGKVAD